MKKERILEELRIVYITSTPVVGKIAKYTYTSFAAERIKLLLTFFPK